MSKSLLSAILLLITSPFVNAQIVDKQDMRLVGPVRSVREESSKLENRSGRLSQGPRVLIRSITFDQQGHSIEDMSKNLDGSPRWNLSWERTYDSDGKETQRAHINDHGALISLGRYTYDSSGKKTKMTRYSPDGAVSFYQEYVYDEQGRIKEEYDRYPDQIKSGYILYVYNDKGQLAERGHYSFNESPSARFIFTYDTYGNLSGTTELLGTGNILYRETLTYDDKGNLLQHVIYGGGDDGTQYTYSDYKFDRLGNWIEKKTVQQPVGKQTGKIETSIDYRTLTYYSNPVP